MKLALALLLLPGIAVAQWRPVAVSSKTYLRDTTENFRRASVFANQKLNKFGDDTMYGALTVSSLTVTNTSTLGTANITTASLSSVAITTMTASSSTITALTATTLSASTATINNVLYLSTYSATANGFTEGPNDVYHQWGYFVHTSSDGSVGNITYPKAFASATGGVTGNTVYSSGSGCFLQFYNVLASGFSYRIGNPGNTGTCTASYWQAIGY